MWIYLQQHLTGMSSLLKVCDNMGRANVVAFYPQDIVAVIQVEIDGAERKQALQLNCQKISYMATGDICFEYFYHRFHGGYFFFSAFAAAFRRAFSASSFSLNFTILVMSVTGSGLSSGNCTAPLEFLYLVISCLKAAMPEPVG